MNNENEREHSGGRRELLEKTIAKILHRHCNFGWANYYIPSEKFPSLIEELVGKKAQIDYRPWHPADMAATWADISKARKFLDWSPQTTFREGLGKLVNWYEENREWAREIDTD